MLSAEMTWPTSGMDEKNTFSKATPSSRARICQALSLVFWVTTQSSSAAASPAFLSAVETVRWVSGFEFPDVETDYWLPLGLSPQVLARRNSHFLHVVGRIRPDRAAEGNGLVLFLACDNLVKGAALNALQIAELLLEPARATA